MSKILEAFDNLAKRHSMFGWNNPAIRSYIETGDEGALSAIPSMSRAWHTGVVEALPDPDAWTDEATRVLIFAHAKEIHSMPAWWLKRYCHRLSSAAMWQHFDAAVDRLRATGMGEPEIRKCLLDSCKIWDKELKKPTQAGELVLQGSAEEMTAGILGVAAYDEERIAALMAFGCPDHLEKLLDDGLVMDSPESHYGAMARANPRRFADKAFKFSQQVDDIWGRIRLTEELAEISPELYQKPALDLMASCVKGALDNDPTSRNCCQRLLRHHHPEAVALTCGWMSQPLKGRDPDVEREVVLKEVAAKSPEDARLMAQACAQAPVVTVVAVGLRYWLQLGVGESGDLLEKVLRGLLTHADNDAVLQGISSAREWNVERLQEALWPLLEHNARPVRGAAARALAELGYAASAERALKLLENKKAEVRQAAVTLLGQIAAAEALGALKQRLHVEESDDVRDDILLALERAGSPLVLSPDEQQERIVKTLAKAKAVPAEWISVDALVFKRKDGSTLSRDETRYLLIRQSRSKEMSADVEAKPLYASLDRAASADTALALVQAFLGGKQDAAERWVLTLAALTGDDKLVPLLHKSILDWADNSRGKLAEYGAQALALLGTDAAMMVVDSLSVRFRSKNKNIGQAAADAFAAAAEARGVTVDELGDIVVPWLGFEPGKPRLIDTAKGQVEARIDADMKLGFRDVKTGEAMSKMPAGASAEIQAEFKTLAGTLKEAVKAQSLRVETLLVRQFRWPVRRWRELYLSHPLLKAFTQRLVWCWRDDNGVLQRTFRALDDGMLTDVEDKSVDLSEKGSVSLVHPLDLTEEARSAWLRHLADHNIAPPFPQFDRPVVRVKPEDVATTFGKQVAGTEVNAMTFRGRAEKLGWSRGSVCDAGGVTAYRKIFTGAGLEAFIFLEDMFIGITMDDSITLGDVFFVKSGSVQVGSHVYDEPYKKDDPRLIPFGQVPAVPFSEIMGDLAKISGKAAETTPESEPP